MLAVSEKRSLYEALHSLAMESRELIGANHATGIYRPEPDQQRALTVTSVTSEYEPYRDYFDRLDFTILLEGLGTGRKGVQAFASDRLPEACSANSVQDGALRPPKRSGLVAAILSRDQHILGLIYLTGNVAHEFSSEDEALLSQFIQIGPYLLELHQSKETLEARVSQRANELAEANRELLRSNEELEQFACISSHDLQEPLRAVAGYCQLLESDFGTDLSAKGRECMHNIVDGAKRAKQLINDLLLYARLSQNGQAFESIDCNAAVVEVLRNLRASFEESGATIHCYPLPVVRGDLRQLVQLFQNLIGNAIKYRSKMPLEVSISACETDKDWTFSVMDNGIGIAPEFRERIFVIFQRLHKREQYVGTGIGLAVCKRIANRHGGRIWVEQSASGDSTFRFTLPKIAIGVEPEDSKTLVRQAIN